MLELVATLQTGSGDLEDDVDHMLNSAAAFLLGQSKLRPECSKLPLPEIFRAWRAGAYKEAIQQVGHSILTAQGLHMARALCRASRRPCGQCRLLPVGLHR